MDPSQAVYFAQNVVGAILQASVKSTWFYSAQFHRYHYKTQSGINNRYQSILSFLFKEL